MYLIISHILLGDCVPVYDFVFWCIFNVLCVGGCCCPCKYCVNWCRWCLVSGVRLSDGGERGRGGRGRREGEEGEGVGRERREREK